MTTTTITVTQDDIAKGTPRQGSGCPITLALRRALPQFPGLYSSWWTHRHAEHPSSAFMRPRGGMTEGYVLPPEVYAFMRAFDNGEQVAPFTFELTLPDEAMVTAS